MKKLLLTTVLAILVIAATAQEPRKTFCEIIGTGKVLSSKVKIQIDFGVIVLAILTMAAIAQEPYKAYCEIVGTGNITGTKVKIEVDFGQKAKWATPNARFLVDENGEKMNFNSMIDAVNYLAKLGWELILAYPVTPTQGMSKMTVKYILEEAKPLFEEVFIKGDFCNRYFGL